MADRLRWRVALLFAGLAAGLFGALGAGLALAYQRLGAPELAGAFLEAGLLAGFAIAGLVVWAWLVFDTHGARAIEALAANLRAHAQSDLDGELEIGRAQQLGDLGPAAAAVVDRLASTRGALDDAVARETTRLSTEKGRLEAILSDVPVGVLLCSGAHQLVFYNGQAVDLLSSGTAPGLDRNLFDYLRDGPVRHAHERLVDSGEPDAAADLLCATTGEARVLAGRMRLLEAYDVAGAPGYVLTLRDVTADLDAHAKREQLLAEVFDRVRRPAANLQTVVGVMAESADMPHTERLNAAILEEVSTLVHAINELGARYDEGRTDWWPLSQTRSTDLMDGLRARLESAGVVLAIEDPGLILRCDGFELVALLSELCAHVASREGCDDLCLRLIEEDGPGAAFELSWAGPPMPMGDFEEWLAAPLDVGVTGVTGRSVLFNHGTEAWPEPLGDGRSAIRVPIREARRAVRRPPPITRSVVYDFDLLAKQQVGAVADTPLADLTYVVFDSETTGLDTARDEIVQLAAVRVVNCRVVRGEQMDTLVDPGRPIPAGSTQVHGITDQMVQGAPDPADTVARFHRFAAGAVLIAHNAPFDMAFLQRHAAAQGAGFDNPVLDTVLLSAVVFGRQETHSLDALSTRLGITIPEEARHTALGDTIATAQAFLKLLPMLQARGIVTFGDVLAEVRRHGRLLEDLNS